jgi:hypothetical protein
VDPMRTGIETRIRRITNANMRLDLQSRSVPPGAG